MDDGGPPWFGSCRHHDRSGLIPTADVVGGVNGDVYGDASAGGTGRALPSCAQAPRRARATEGRGVNQPNATAWRCIEPD